MASRPKVEDKLAHAVSMEGFSPGTPTASLAFLMGLVRNGNEAAALNWCANAVDNNED